jgi:hypothetical protein
VVEVVVVFTVVETALALGCDGEEEQAANTSPQRPKAARRVHPAGRRESGRWVENMGTAR